MMLRGAFLLVLALCASSASPASSASSTSSPSSSGGTRPCTCHSQAVDCSARNKTSISPEEICVNATTARLQNNHLRFFPDGLNTFNVIFASDNRLTRLPTAEQLNPRVWKLELNNNLISRTTNEFRHLSALTLLRLEGNRLTDLQFLPEPCNLKILEVSNNVLSTLDGPLRNCTALSFLGVADNRLTNISSDVFSQMHNLQDLYLSGNNLHSVPDGAFAGLVKLTNLAIGSNNEISLTPGMFRGLGQLKKLSATPGKLQSLPAGIFSSTPKLEILEFSINQIEVLPSDVFSGLKEIKELSFWSNRLTTLPVLRNCCDKLEKADFYSNNISAVSEEAVRSMLRGNAKLRMKFNPLRASALHWTLTADDVTTSVNPAKCNCGELRKGNAVAEFCMYISCGANDTIVDWVAAVRGTAPQ